MSETACNHTCRECGKQEQGQWIESTQERLIRRQLCFTCGHWTEAVEEWSKNPGTVRVGGVHYMFDADKPKVSPSRWNGFGGALWKIRFKDGRIVETNNLWCQGDIPEHFRERLPDNAEFLPCWERFFTSS